ncbi:MAG: ribosome maturation factor RimM [Litorimonas sp.]
MIDIDPKTLVCVAMCAGAFGVKGEIKLKSFTQDPKDCVLYGPLYNNMGKIILTRQSHRVMTHHIALKAAEISQREDAQALSGTELYVPRHVLPAPDNEDDFYYSDLIGLEVKSTSGQRMGKIIAVHEFGAGDMLEIQPSAKTAEKSGKASGSFFHPFTKAAVPKIDLATQRVIIHIVEAENGREPNSV